MSDAGLIPFIGTMFFAVFFGVMFFVIGKKRTERTSSDGTVVMEESVKHKFLQLIFLFIIVLMLQLNGLTVLDMTSTNCAWRVTNSTTTGSTTAYASAYTCELNNSNAAGTTYARIINWTAYLLGFYVIIYVLVMGYKYLRDAANANKRRQGR